MGNLGAFQYFVIIRIDNIYLIVNTIQKYCIFERKMYYLIQMRSGASCETINHQPSAPYSDCDGFVIDLGDLPAKSHVAHRKVAISFLSFTFNRPEHIHSQPFSRNILFLHDDVLVCLCY